MDEYRMIDGKDVSDFLSGFLLFINKVINYLFSSVKKNFWIAIVIFILVTTTGFLYAHRTGKLYEAEMVCEFTDLSKKTYGEMVQKLDNLAKTNSYIALANNLHISPVEANEIVSIEGRNISGSMLYEDVTPDRGPMYFRVTAKNNLVFATLQKSLLDYLNNTSPYGQQQDRMELERISHKTEFLKKDILLVDSLISAFPGALKNINLGDTTYKIANVPALFQYKNKLEEELLMQEWRAKELKSPVQLLYGFVPTDHTTGIKSKTLATIIFMACVLSCLVAMLLNALKQDSNSETV